MTCKLYGFRNIEMRTDEVEHSLVFILAVCVTITFSEEYNKMHLEVLMNLFTSGETCV